MPLSKNDHHGICPEDISLLVEEFYQRVFNNKLLAPVFKEQTTDEWETHLEKMKAFWRSVILKTGEYKGKPIPAHQRLEGISNEHFEEWLKLFGNTSKDLFNEDESELVTSAATRIATSLWLSRASDPFESPPEWSSAREQKNKRPTDIDRRTDT